MRELNPEHISAVIGLINESPYFKHLAMVVRELRNGHSVVELDIDQRHLNPFGGIHGGVYSSIIDTAAYWSVYCELEEDAGLISIDVYVNNLRPISEGRLTVVGRRLKLGRSICLAEAVVSDDNDVILAQGTSKMMVTPHQQTIEAARASSGFDSLPPKFLD